MLKRYELLNFIKDALLDLPDVSDKPNEDGTYSVFDKKVEKDENGDLIFTFTDEHGLVREQETYVISAKLVQAKNERIKENPCFVEHVEINLGDDYDEWRRNSKRN